MACLKILGLLTLGMAIGVGIIWHKVNEPPDLPEIPDTYWGPGNSKPDDTSIKSFTINYPETELEDLIRRLNNTRELQPPLEGIGFQYGTNTDYLKSLLDFWRKDYKWREREVYLNQFPQFTTQISGLNIHFIHAKPKKASLTPKTEVIPLLVLHGWPGSVREFYELIPFLTTPRPDDRNFVFEVIAPSLPGYGFSEAAHKPGLNVAQISVIMHKLMQRLGYQSYFVQGGDWGSMIGRNLALLYPESVKGYHANICNPLQSVKNRLQMMISSMLPSLFAEEGHVERLSQQFSFLLEESGYMHLQATKPDTAGVGLTDSPAGLAAYIVEKFSTWTSPSWRNKLDGGLHHYNKENLIDNLMFYWMTRSITTSMRLYSETINKKYMGLGLDRIPVSVPSGCALFPAELMYIPKAFLEDGFTRLVRVTDMPKGGHFAAFEVPDLLAEDVWQFVAEVRKLSK